VVYGLSVLVVCPKPKPEPWPGCVLPLVGGVVLLPGELDGITGGVGEGLVPDP